MAAAADAGALETGMAVVLHGLSVEALNGRRGTLGSFDEGRGRWQVWLGPRPGWGERKWVRSRADCSRVPEAGPRGAAEAAGRRGSPGGGTTQTPCSAASRGWASCVG